MTLTRAAVYGGAGILLVAYLASANSSTLRHRDAMRRAAPGPPSPQSITADIQQEAGRLRARMAHAPAPDANPRNPFAFAPVRTPPPAAANLAHATAADSAQVAAPPTPELSLIGMAEDPTAAGVRRVAILSGVGDSVYFVSEGDALLGRYRVAKIGADAIELDDVLTHGVRRLAMR
ncbi:MAG: hypothetical protein ACRD1V_02995 [Vicinamibacterales bacterium]